MVIRKATADDSKDISRIHALSWKAAYKGIVPQAYLDELKEDFWFPAFDTWFNDKALSAKVMLDNGIMFGCVTYGKARDQLRTDWGEVVSLYLLPEYFGKGYGRTLLESAMLDFKQSGFKNIYLWVLKDNKRARRFYEKNNWTLNKEDICVCEIAGKQLTEVFVW